MVTIYLKQDESTMGGKGSKGKNNAQNVFFRKDKNMIRWSGLVFLSVTKFNNLFNFELTMSEKDIQKLIDLAESQIKAGVTAEQVRQTMVSAGILNADGEYTAPYQQLFNECMEQK